MSADELEVEVEEVEEVKATDDSDLLTDGESYFPSLAELAKESGAVCIQQFEGGIFLYIPGEGSTTLADWCKKRKRDASVTSITGAKR